MNHDDKTRFALSTIAPMTRYTFPYVASIFGVENEGRKGVHVGSGLRCMLNGRRAILTAWHVVDRAMGYSGFAVSAGYGVPPFPISGEVHFEEALDLAIHFLPSEYPDSESIAFWPEDRVDSSSDRRGTDFLFVHGFPGVQTAWSDHRTGVESQSLPYGCMEKSPRPKDLREHEFALEFDPAGIASVEIPEGVNDPRGMSGSAVWRIGASGKKVKGWRPEWALLVGVVTQWDTTGKFLVATDIESAMKAFKACPALVN